MPHGVWVRVPPSALKRLQKGISDRDSSTYAFFDFYAFKIGSMNIVEDKIDDLNAVLKVTITEEDYKGTYETALKETRKRANIPGFRNGKVPMGMVKKMYGKSILADELNKMLNREITEYINEHKLQVLGSPLPKSELETGDWDNPSEFNFAYELGLAPAFEVKLSGRDKVVYNSIKVDDELINKQIEDLGRRYGKLSNTEVSTEKDMLYGDFIQLDEAGEILEGGIMHQSTIALEFIENEDAKKITYW